MGNDQKKPPAKKMDLDDAIIQMKIQSKGVMRAAKKAEKQSDQYMKKAKDAMKKNNEDFAKLHLISASQKKNEATNYQRTAIKMELMCDRMKSQRNNQQMVNTFGNMTQQVNQQMAQMDNVKMFEQMQMFNNKMDQVMINNKMMTEVMTGNDLVDNNTDHMMDALKQEIAMEEKNNLHQTGQKQQNYNTNTNKNTQNTQQYQQQTTQNSGAKQQQDHDPFLDQLKGL